MLRNNCFQYRLVGFSPRSRLTNLEAAEDPHLDKARIKNPNVSCASFGLGRSLR